MNRRWRNLTTRLRRRRFDPPWVGLAPAPPPALPGFRDQPAARPRWYALARRGRFLPVPSPPVQAPTARPVGFIEPTRPRALTVRRGRFLAVPQRYAPPLPFIERTRPTAVAARRGRFLPILATPTAAPAFAVTDRRLTAPPRRGQFFTVPRAVALAGPGPVPPAIARQARRAQLPVRRGEFLPLPIAIQIPAGAGPVPPTMLRQSRRPQVPVRHGVFATPVPLPPVVPGFVPRQVRRTAARSLLIRRGEFLLVPPSASPVARATRQAPRRLVITRRGEFLTVPPAAPPPAAAPVVPTMLSRQRRLVAIPPRGAFQPALAASSAVVIVVAEDPRLTVLPNLSGARITSVGGAAQVAPNPGGFTITPNLATAAVAANQAEADL